MGARKKKFLALVKKSFVKRFKNRKYIINIHSLHSQIENSIVVIGTIGYSDYSVLIFSDKRLSNCEPCGFYFTACVS